MSYNLPPNNPNDPNRPAIDLGGIDAPDFRARVRQQPDRQDPPYDDEPPRRSGGDSNGDGRNDEDPSGCINIGGFHLNWQMVIFLFVLLVAGLRGGANTKGCIPSRQCLNGIFAILGGTALFIAGAYYGFEGGNESLALAVTCGGALICLVGGGGMIFLMMGILRSIDFTPGDSTDSGGILDSIFGGNRR